MHSRFIKLSLSYNIIPNRASKNNGVPMKNVRKWFILPVAAALLLAGCKSKQEKMADEFLEQGKLTNAINFYTKAEQKGKISETFYDNFALAYLRMAMQTTKKDPMSTIVPSYLEQVDKFVAKSTNTAVIEEYVGTLAQIGSLQAQVEGVYEFTLQGFHNLKHAEEVSAKNGKVGAAAIQTARDQAEKKYIATVITAANGEANTVAREYELLLGEVVAPNNAELKTALNEVRKKNRGDFLIFEASGVENPSRWVNKYGYVMAFPSLSIGGSETKGELQFWNSSGNNSDFDGSGIKLVSVDGKEVPAKGSFNGWCTGNDPIKPVKEKLKGGRGKLLDEGTCSINVSFSYGGDFVPDYVEYKDQFGVGRKYLGQ